MPYDKVYDDITCPLTWLKLLITDRGSEFKAIKKLRVSSKSSYPCDGPVGYEEKKLPPDISVRYLFEPNDLEGGSRRAGDMNWSPKIYHIHMSLTQKNQPVLYWLIDDDGKESERSFVREELLVIPDDTELPPQWVLTN
ncbi:unnamed protein product [Rhizophagus irregularis]|nr:unnamed protein product [Rhizophagus irregularis]